MEARGGSIVLWTAGIGVIVFGWQAWLLSGNEPGFVALSLLLVALPWAFGAIASSMEGTEATEFLDDAPGPMLAGLCAGLIGFMLHTGIDLAMFWPGAATGFFAMMAIALAVRECSSRSRDANGVEAAPGIARRWSSDTAAGEPAPGLEATPRPRHRLDTSRLCGSGAPVGSNRRVACLAIGAGGIAFVLLLLILLVRPTASVGKFLQDGRLGVEALAAELIRRLSNVERDDSVAGIIEDLHRRDPANSATWRQIGALLSKRIEPNRDPARFHQQAISGIRQAVARYAMSWSAYVSSPSYDSYRDAIQCYRLDGTAAEELADELSRRVSSVEQVDQVVGRVEGFERRDPANTIVRHQFATLYYQRFAIGGDVADLERSIASMRQAVAGYPTSPTKHLLLADLLEKLAAVTDSIDARRSAAADLQAALDLDAKRIYVSKPHRFTDEMRGEIGRRIERLLRGQSATTNPVRSTTRDS